MTGSYRRAERVGIACGLAELVFVPAMIMAHPDLHAISRGLSQFPLAKQFLRVPAGGERRSGCHAVDDLLPARSRRG